MKYIIGPLHSVDWILIGTQPINLSQSQFSWASTLSRLWSSWWLLNIFDVLEDIFWCRFALGDVFFDLDRFTTWFFSYIYFSLSFQADAIKVVAFRHQLSLQQEWLKQKRKVVGWFDKLVAIRDLLWRGFSQHCCVGWKLIEWMLEFEKLLTEFATEWQDPILDCFVSQQICIYKVDGNWGQILSMLGMKMAVSSFQSYC